MRTLAAVCLSACASLTAQTQVIPATFATTEAATSTNFPFGLSTPSRVQYLYGAGETGFAGPVTIRSVNLRANGTSANAAKANIDLQITMSTTRVTVGTASTTFANNHGSNVSVVYVRKMTSLAATVSGPVGGYGGALALDAPFNYDPAAGNLVIDFDIAYQPAGTWTMDTPFTTAGTHADIGTACGGLTATSTGGAIGGPLTLGTTGGAAGNPALLLIGTTTFPVPIPVPGNPACNLYNDFSVVLPVTLSPTGAATLTITVPPIAAFRGAVAFSQWGAVNAGLFYTTQSRHMTMASWVVLRVHNTSNNNSPTGAVQNYVGIVIELGT